MQHPIGGVIHGLNFVALKERPQPEILTPSSCTQFSYAFNMARQQNPNAARAYVMSGRHHLPLFDSHLIWIYT